MARRQPPVGELGARVPDDDLAVEAARRQQQRRHPHRATAQNVVRVRLLALPPARAHTRLLELTLPEHGYRPLPADRDDAPLQRQDLRDLTVLAFLIN